VRLSRHCKYAYFCVAMPTFIDQIGNTVHLPKVPRRIISLVPSQSEYLWDLGLKEELIGITKFCIHPADLFKKKTKVGGTKTIDIAKIRELKPDLIIGNKEENSQEQIALLSKEFDVWMSDVKDLEGAYRMMMQLGQITDRQAHAEAMVAEIRDSVASVKGLFEGKEAAYLMWYKPLMAVGNDTFIDQVLEHVGFINCFKKQPRYPEISEANLMSANLEICLLSSEPYPFKEKHLSELAAIVPNTKLVLVDGEMFSWYGSRLLKLANYLKKLKSTF
jgi:ABC-type Fe3+-hydroxamate transport system substrate-binding protein